LKAEFTKYDQLVLHEEAARCLICHEPACTQACPKGIDAGKFVRSLRFDNLAGALDKAVCDCKPENGKAPCESACVHPVTPIQLTRMMKVSDPYVTGEAAAADLSINFCGVPCENPFFLSSSIVASNYEMCKKALEMGWGGIVFKTVGVFRPVEVSPRFDSLRTPGTPFYGFKNLEQIAEHPLEENLAFMRRLKEDFPSKILIASIMGENDEEWSYLAKAVTEIGADIIECNFSCPHMSGDGLGSDVGQDPELVKHYTEIVKAATHIPVLAKMTPNIGNMEIPAIAAMKGGADGIAAINTIKSIAGIDMKTLTGTPEISGKSAVSGYSGKAVKPIALRFIHDMAQHPALKNVPISGMGGIETWHDALEFIVLGSSNIQITTAVMQYGYRIIDDLIDGLSRFMKENGYQTLDELVGLALPQMVPADKLDRETVVYPKFVRENCSGCGRCYIACYDAGHQAIRWDSEAKRPILDGAKCVGCHLCRHVCESEAIEVSKRVKKHT
jgi:dihydropyrimidine dehydrogenase (NAD+) subunit PreA